MTTEVTNTLPNAPDCWVFDSNRRVYAKNENGNSFGGPIWKEHWTKVCIVDETSRSWVTSNGRKIPKKGGRGIAFSMKEVEHDAWVNDNRYELSHRVSMCRDYKTLIGIEQLLNEEMGVE